MFDINFAFDALTQSGLRQLRQAFGFKGLKPLTFDEFEEKFYMVKCSEPPSISYIPFGDRDNNGNGTRLYKGEGTVTLVAYYPFGIGEEQIINQSSFELAIKAVENSKKTVLVQNSSVIPFGINTDAFQFQSDSDLSKLTINGGTPYTITYERGQIKNIGDLPSNILTVRYRLRTIRNSGATINLEDTSGLSLYELRLKPITSYPSEDTFIEINFKTQLIEGLDENFHKTGNLYNSYIESGDFFSIPVGTDFYLTSTPNYIKNNGAFFRPIYY